MEFVATCPKGFERLLGDELRALGVPGVRPLRGQVAFGGELADAYRVCLWSRLASRVQLVLARFEASDADALYAGVASVAWVDHLSRTASFAVDASGTNAQLKNTRFTALRAKDAVADTILAVRGMRPQTDPAHPDVRIDVHIAGERGSVAIDLAGEPLFRRGYVSVSDAHLPALRPDYASALLAALGWCAEAGTPRELIALWPGQGSLVCEAASAALGRAPGLLRTRWGFSRWLGHDSAAWQDLLEAAKARADKVADPGLVLLAADTRRGAKRASRQALRAAGMDADLVFASPQEALSETPGACVVSDLSWISACALAEEASCLSMISMAAGRHLAALTCSSAIDAALRAAPADTIDVLVGRDPATIRIYAASEVMSAPAVEVAGERVAVLVSASDQFAARLAKVARQRAKWARREDISCYRVYDADLPDYAVSIDLFEGSKTPGRWLQIYEYAPPKGVDPELARRRLLDVLTIAPKVMGVKPGDVSLRVRARARGGSQYADEARARGGRASTGAHLIDEGGLTFEVDFDARFDCGIFLDHRETRSLIRELMKATKGSKRFLNLFAYTGTATCYAADGGAKHTTTVDLSRPSLDWARRNMERNGFVTSDKGHATTHEFVQADALTWVANQRHTKNRWDLIFCDVPTFSNSSRMAKASFDVQRDHAELIIGVSRLLTREGTAVFSCNLRTFVPDVDKLERAGVHLKDITPETIPPDFSRNRRVHHCYLVTRG